jgi:two-component system sensor histidine kinase KdpD
LRELALRETALEVMHRLPDEHARASPNDTASAGRRHKILVVVTPAPETAMVIRRAKRVGDVLGADCFAVTAQRGGDLKTLREGDRDAIERHLNFARNLHIETRILEGEDFAASVIEFARRNDVSQIFVARKSDAGRRSRFSRDLVQTIVSLANDMQVVIVSDRTPAERV